MNDSGPRLLSPVAAERRAALAVVARQALVALVVAGIAGLGFGFSAARSALLGGAIGVAATLLFVIALFRYREGTSAARVAWSFYLGQALKVILTVALLALVFRSRGIAPLAVLAGYVATYLAYWFTPRGPASRW
ncbi:MAG: ATP synthase subunit I [Proteobacteria bacterium]|nr:ATP synthase subunit I [Pseudomonadota bacterium]